MSTAPEGILDQAHRLVQDARLLPADEAVQVLEQVATIAQAAQAEVLAAAERSGDLKDAGCRTARSFAATILRRSTADATAVAQVALHLVAFPQLAAAYRAGLAHTGNLRTIVRHLKPCGIEVLQAHETQLLLLATQAGPREIDQFCRHLADLHRPDHDEAGTKALGQRSVRIARVGDLAHLDAMLDPVIADQLHATLAAMTKATRTVQVAEALEPPVTKTHAERSAYALETILATGIDRFDLPTQTRRRPHATISVQLETLLGMGGHGKALLARFGLIAAATAARVACDAAIRLVVTHGDRVLNVGTTARVVTDRQLVALAQTYQTCVMPGCAIRFADCDIHHLWWYSLGGPTDLDLQVPLCRSHHTCVHEGGTHLTREHGHLVFRDPHGRTITNTHQILQDQLDLLHPPPPPPPTGTGEWPDTPYLHGRWGRTGQDPDPPPDARAPKSVREQPPIIPA
jgi:Domain of unknown function (DUF222)